LCATEGSFRTRRYDNGRAENWVGCYSLPGLHVPRIILAGVVSANAKLHDRVPLVTRDGTEAQIKEALARKPAATLKVDDIVEDSIVRELEKSGILDKVYK
jgi:hypothetical protein